MSQILHLADPRLNMVDLEFPGETTAGDLGVSRFLGQVGAAQVFRNDEVKYNSTIGTLYGGRYQLVLTKSASTIAPARGLIAFWNDGETVGDFVVTPDIPAGNSLVAGIYLSAPTKGQYCMIQTSGLCSVQAVASITKGTPAIGDIGSVSTGAKVNILADATAVTWATLRTRLGIFYELPVNNLIKQFELQGALQRD